MIRARPLPFAPGYLRECFDYDPETGMLTWRERPSWHFRTERARNSWNARYAGYEAGKSKSNGYRLVGLVSEQYQAGRLIFKLMTGRDPVFVDHRDRNPANNRWNNLREATATDNARNRSARHDNLLGIKGVRETPYGKFEARILINRKPVQLGTFATVNEARAAYLGAARAHWGKFASGG